MDFRGRTVIVSGAASGIGMAAAAVFGDRGARVVGVDVVAPTGPLAAEFHRVDLRGAGVAERIVRLAGTVDVVCNVAGGHPPVEDRVRWQATVDANLTTAYRMSEAAIPVLPPGSAVVNVSSLVGTAIGDDPPYAAAKAGVVGLTRAHARLLGPHGIRVNCVAPGPIGTPAWGTEGVGAEWVNRTPLRRPGHPDDVARVIAFLASDDAAYVTGTCLIVDGGMSVAGGPDSA